MALKYAPHSDFNFSDNWCDGDDGVQDVIKPGGADVAIFTGNSDGTCTLDESPTIGGLGMSGNPAGGIGDSIDLNGNVLTVGDAIFDGSIGDSGVGGSVVVSGHFTKVATVNLDDISVTLNGTGNVTCNGVSGGFVNINTAGTHTAADAQLWEGFTCTTGYATGNFAHGIDGNISIAGTFAPGTAVWTMTASGTIANGTSGNSLYQLAVAAGVTCETAGTTYLQGLAVPATATFTVSHITFLYGSAANDRLDVAGAVDGASLLLMYEGNSRSQKAVTLACDFSVRLDNGQTLTMTGALNIGTKNLSVEASGAGVCTLDLGLYGLIAGALVLGDTNANDQSGVLKCGEGIVVIASLAAGNAANLANAILLNRCYLEAAGTLDFDNIVHTAAADDVVHINCLPTGEVINFDPAEIVHVHGDGSVDGGGNNGVNNVTTFNTHDLPWFDTPDP